MTDASDDPRPTSHERSPDDDRLRDLAKDLPFELPTASRRDAIRSSLLVEAAESNVAPSVAPRRWLGVGSAFVAGALAAAAIAVIVVRRDREPLAPITPAQITSSPNAKLDHQIVRTDTGVDEIINIRDGKVRLSVPAVRRGDHVRVQTKTAEVEGDAGELEVVVVADALESVTVHTGTARVVVAGKATFLSAGQTWRASVITTDLSPTAPDRVAVRSSDPTSPTEKPDTAVRSSDPASPTEKPDTAVRSSDPASPTLGDGVRSSAPADSKPVTKQPSDSNPPLTSVDSKQATAKQPVTSADSKQPTKQPVTSVDSKQPTKQPVTSADSKQPTKQPVTSVDSKQPTAKQPPVANVDSKQPTVKQPPVTNVDSKQPTAKQPPVTNVDSKQPTAKQPTVSKSDTTDSKKPTNELPTTVEPAKPTVIEPAKPDRSKQTAIEQQFRKGWELLRAGKAREAAIELGAAADSMPESPLAADARYWQAVALIRAGQTRDAERVLVQFLDNAPKSLRRGRAAVLLGRVLAERGDRKTAAAWFETAVGDPDPAIANAARAGLQALQKK